MTKGFSKYLITIILVACGAFSGQAQVVNGELILTEQFYQDEDDMELAGRWRFYRNELLSPQEPRPEGKPNFEYLSTPWSELPGNSRFKQAKGYATYELDIFSTRASEDLALRIPEFYSAYDLYLNGELVSKNGEVGEDISSVKPYWLPRIIGISLREGQNRLLLRVANFHHFKGGAVAPISIGNARTFFFYKNLAVSASLFIAGALLISAVFSLIVYYFQRLDFTFLFYGLFALSYIYRVIGTDTYILHEIFDRLSWHVAIRLEYLSLFLSVIFFTYFYKNLIARRAPEWLFHSIGIASAVMILSLFLPERNFSALIDYYLIYLLLAFITSTIFYLRAMRISHTMSWFTTIAVGSLMFVTLMKMGAFFGFGGSYFFVSFFGYMVFVISQTIALSQRFGYNMRQHISQSETAVVSQRNFLNAVSHELKTPMNAIMGMTEFLSKTELNSDQKSKLETIRKNSDQLNNLLQDLLNFSQVEAGELKLDVRKFDLKEVLNKAIQQSGAASTSKINFKLNYDDNIPEELAGDPERLGQVIYHLLGNAVKFTDKGIVSLTLRMESVEGNKVRLYLEVQDTGVGIKAEDLDKVIQAFNQGNEGNTRTHGGTGLGLTVSARIIELMDGELWIDSNFGEGTTVRAEFNLKTPRLNLSKHAEEINEKKDGKIEGLRVLYAEDNPINQKLLVMIMKTMGYEVDLADNGLEAWEMALTKRYHIIFMDVQMPKMDGIEATQRIIKDQPERPIIIAVTANAEVADQKRCIEAGMNDFIPKPFNAKMLKDAIRKWQGLLQYMEEDSGNDKLRVIS